MAGRGSSQQGHLQHQQQQQGQMAMQPQGSQAGSQGGVTVEGHGSSRSRSLSSDRASGTGSGRGRGRGGKRGGRGGRGGGGGGRSASGRRSKGKAPSSSSSSSHSTPRHNNSERGGPGSGGTQGQRGQGQRQRQGGLQQPPRGGGAHRGSMAPTFRASQGPHSAVLLGTSPGGGKRDGNHLLGFTFEQRGVAASDAGKGHLSGRGYRSPSKGGRASHHCSKPLSREQYMQANCSFFIKATAVAKHSPHAVDPDILVDWADVVEVHMQSHAPPRCPICLGPPLAGQTTRCGHIYCRPCIMHHLAVSESQTWAYCPLCEDYVYARDLRSVVVREVPRHAVAAHASFRLMCREKNSVFVAPLAQWPLLGDGLQALLCEGVEEKYLKLHVASNARIHDTLLRELHELMSDEADATDPYVQASLKTVREQLAQYEMVEAVDAAVDAAAYLDTQAATSAWGTATATPSRDNIAAVVETSWPSLPAPAPQQPPAPPQQQQPQQQEQEPPAPAQVTTFNPGAPSFNPAATPATIGFKVPASDPEPAKPAPEDEGDYLPPPPGYNAPFGGSSDAPVAAGPTTTTASSHPPGRVSPPTAGPTPAANATISGSAVTLFYQVADGQIVFLHPLNVRCLIKEHGAMSQCPPTIRGRIVEMEHQVVTSETRRRLKYLNHLPLHCEFVVCELDLRDQLSSDTLREFLPELEKRRQQRKRRARQEKRREKELRSKAADAAPLANHVYDHRQFPRAQDPDVPLDLMGPPLGFDGEGNAPGMLQGSPGGAPADPAFASFSKACGGGIMSSLEENPPLSVAMTTSQGPKAKAPAVPMVWGRPVPAASAAMRAPPRPEAEAGGVAFSPPDFKDSFRAAMDRALSASPSTDEATTGAPRGGRKKKTKRTKKLLFSTDMKLKS